MDHDRKLPRPWTARETKELRRRFEAGQPQAHIARVMDRSNQSIMSKVKEMRKHWNGPAPRPYIGRPPSDLPSFDNDEGKHLARVFAADPKGFPVIASRAHSRMRAA